MKLTFYVRRFRTTIEDNRHQTGGHLLVTMGTMTQPPGDIRLIQQFIRGEAKWDRHKTPLTRWERLLRDS